VVEKLVISAERELHEEGIIKATEGHFLPEAG